MEVKGPSKVRRAIHQQWPKNIHNSQSKDRWIRDSRCLNQWWGLSKYTHPCHPWWGLRIWISFIKATNLWEHLSTTWFLLISSIQCIISKCITNPNNMILFKFKSFRCQWTRTDHRYLSSTNKWTTIPRAINSTATTTINFNDKFRLPQNK